MNHSDIGHFLAHYDPPVDYDRKNKQYLPEGIDQPYRLANEDRRRHLYLIGQTGTGKSTLLQNLIAEHLRTGAGLAFIDPHGDDARRVLSLCPRARAHQVVYFHPADLELPVGWNPLHGVPEADRPRVADDLVSAFRHIWKDSFGPRLEHILRNSLRLCLDLPDATFLTILRLLNDDGFRARVAAKAQDPVVRYFWQVEYEGWDKRYRSEANGPVLNKLGAFLTPPVRGILCQSRSTFDLRRMMDEGRILIVNLSKGEIGEQNAHLLGALLVSGIAQAAFTRGELDPAERRPFHLYVDEFQALASGGFALILSEARKYGLTLTLAHQLLGQIPDELRQAIFGNVGSTVAFRVGAEDAELLASHLGLKDAQALKELPNHTAWGRFLQGGEPSLPILLKTHPPPLSVNHRPERIVRNSRARFGRSRQEIEQWIARHVQLPAQKTRRRITKSKNHYW